MTISGSVDTTLIGEYMLEYVAKDEAGNRSDIMKRVVCVMPQIAVSSSVITKLPSTGPVMSYQHYVVW